MTSRGRFDLGSSFVTLSIFFPVLVVNILIGRHSGCQHFDRSSFWLSALTCRCTNNDHV